MAGGHEQSKFEQSKFNKEQVCTITEWSPWSFFILVNNIMRTGQISVYYTFSDDVEHSEEKLSKEKRSIKSFAWRG